jgi:hypothetical protein
MLEGVNKSRKSPECALEKIMISSLFAIIRQSPFASVLRSGMTGIKKVSTVLLALMLLSVPALVADDTLPDLTLQRPGGTKNTLTQVRLIKVEPDGLRVMHASGTAKVPLEQLPADLASHFGLDASKAAEFRQAQAQAPKAMPALAPVAKATEPKKIDLWTKEAVLSVWLANADPRKIHPLDRELRRKREQATVRTQSLKAGRFNDEAQIAAHEANVKLLAEAGDADGAAQERQAADAAKKALAKNREAISDRQRQIALEYHLINGRPPLWSVGGGSRAP